MSFQHRRTQQRAIFVTIFIVIVSVVVALPLLLFPAFRLTIGYKLHLAPGANAELLLPATTGTELIVLVEAVPVNMSLPTQRFHAVAVAERTDTNVQLHELNNDRVLELPLKTYDFVAASTDRSTLLLVDHTDMAQPQAVVVNLLTGTVQLLALGQTDPGLPGDWNVDIGAPNIDCTGVSPQSTWIACIVQRKKGLSRFVFGDWELQIAPYGDAQNRTGVFRGRGLVPIVGWSDDEHWLYAQNETGIWRIPVPPINHSE